MPSHSFMFLFGKSWSQGFDPNKSNKNLYKKYTLPIEVFKGRFFILSCYVILMLNDSLVYSPLTRKGHFNSNYFMSLIPNERPLENSVVPGNCMVVNVCPGHLTLLGTRFTSLPPLHLQFSGHSEKKLKNKILRSTLKRIFDIEHFWQELQSNEAGKKQKLMRRKVWIRRKVLG